jgi:hypothetical protein
MAPPFSADQFFAVFSRYNQAVFPIQIAFFILAAASVVAAVRWSRSSRLIVGFLALLWAWMGVVYHWIFFASINPAAMIFGALFVLEAALLVWFSVNRGNLVVKPELDVFGVMGGLLLAYGLVVYPVLNWTVGHRYPAQPTFGLPCPTTIFTMGMLLWVKGRVPWHLLVVPALWSVVGTSAVRYFGVIEDAALPVAGIAGAGALLLRNRRLAAEAPIAPSHVGHDGG